MVMEILCSFHLAARIPGLFLLVSQTPVRVKITALTTERNSYGDWWWFLTMMINLSRPQVYYGDAIVVITALFITFLIIPKQLPQIRLYCPWPFYRGDLD